MFPHFFDFLFPPRGDEAVVREISEETLLSLVHPRLVAKTDPPTVALLPFSDERVRSVIHEAKYHGNTKSFSLLASAILEYLRDSDTSFFKPEFVLVPVPLGAGRRRERGFNQVEEVARLVAKELQIPLEANLLERVRETTSQVSLPRFRRAENMRSAFALREGAAFDPSKTYVLLDDVVTTGATLAECIRVLKASGARDILPLAFAH